MMMYIMGSVLCERLADSTEVPQLLKIPANNVLGHVPMQLPELWIVTNSKSLSSDMTFQKKVRRLFSKANSRLVHVENDLLTSNLRQKRVHGHDQRVAIPGLIQAHVPKPGWLVDQRLATRTSARERNRRFFHRELLS